MHLLLLMLVLEVLLLLQMVCMPAHNRCEALTTAAKLHAAAVLQITSAGNFAGIVSD